MAGAAGVIGATGVDDVAVSVGAAGADDAVGSVGAGLTGSVGAGAGV